MKAAIKQIVKRFLLLCIPLLLGGNMVYAYPNGVTFEPAESDAETLQGQSDLKNVYEEALKVKKVGAELTFSNNKAYYIKNSRGDLATKDGSLVSTVKTDLGVTASQFAIIRYSGQYYLYSIADKKFICFHNSWISAGTYNIVLNNEDFDPVTITKTDRFTDYPFCINSYMSSNTYYLTTSSSTGNGAIFSRQTADDEEGYHYAIEEAGSFDPTEALTILNAKIPPTPYAVLSNNNTVLTFYYDDQKEDRGGMSVGPFSFESERDWYDQGNTITTVVFDASLANCSSLTSTAYWFYGFSRITTITGIENLKTDNVTDMKGMFNGCSKLTSLDLSDFKTDNVTDMSSMFSNCTNLTSLDLRGFKTDNVTDMENIFSDCSKLETIYVSKGWTTTNVTYGRYMFSNCSQLVGGQGTSYDSSHTDHTYAHIDGGASNPGYLTGVNTEPLPYAVLSDNNTVLTFYYDDQKEDRGGMSVGPFSADSYPDWHGQSNKITTVIFDTSFANCTSLTSTANWFVHLSRLTVITGIENLKTDNVTDMGSMFRTCPDLTSLNLIGFKTDNVTDMRYMFLGCDDLRTIYVGDGWNTTKVTNGTDMFFNCVRLVGGQGTSYDSSHTDHTYAHIDEGTTNPGYLSEIITIAPFVTNDMVFKVTSQAMKKVTYVNGPAAEQITVPSEVTYDGNTYAITAIADSAFAGQSQLKSVKIPSSVKSVGKNLFAGSPHVAAIIWEAPIKMTQEMVGTTVNNPNLLFYASDVSNAPDGVTNIINSQTKQAERIVLWDANENNDFYCPEEFTASSISYTHAYQLFTVSGQCQGWESLVLPFDVTEITHETKGIITPFGILQIGREFDNGTKPFWLYEYTTGGRFAEAEGIKANVPYILSMPNEAKLSDEYILAGNITFKGTNATVKKTSNAKIIKSGDYSFTPSYQNGTSASAYLLNVDQKYDGNPRGSVFVRNDLLERQARPFEAYFRLNGSAGVKSFIGIFDELTDGIRSMDPAKHNGNAEYYQLDGTKRSNFQRGFNIIRTNNKVQKVFIK